MTAPSLVLGTAGHIDHGKSSLVQALTGTDPDRLKEEKDRGITIELGFARLELPSGRMMGVVDVPGHEKFVRQMVAGATGVDVVMLCIAADDGVMPQTREHLAILDLLGVDRGVVALTKADLVDSDWAQMVAEDVRTLLANTALAGSPVVPVSARSGEGLPTLLATLDEIAQEAPSRHAELPLRLPVDRVFTIAGAGTVVTGTMWSGSAAKDDPVEVYPSRGEARVRGVQVHGAGVERAVAGQRVAMNVAGIERSEISRGDIIAAPGTLTVTDRLDARFTYLGFPGDDKPFESGTRVHVHHGTREVLGRVLLVDHTELRAGESGLAQLRLEEPLAPRYDDRFIVRSYSPVYTIGGGVVLDALPPRRTTLKPHERELLEALLAHDLSSASTGLLTSRAMPMTSAEVAAALGVPRAKVADELNKASLERLKVGSDTYFVTASALDGAVGATERELLAFHEADPLATGVATAALRDRVDRRLTARVFDAILEVAAARGVATVDRGQVRHPRAAVSALAQEADAMSLLLPLIEAAGAAPPTLAEMLDSTGVDPGVARKALARLVSEGRLVRVSSDFHFSPAAIAAVRATLEAYFASRSEGATTSDLREALGLSRKYAIPLLEYLDSQGITKREGDLRTLRRA
ncbi:MAG: selenocysteine-specific translation elongation factor [Coriobacteriia bacterium]|nr:selenocysteine-specific translation elongation factor [Coriobacteriia bacterium]